jgi:hypothetical protein
MGAHRTREEKMYCDRCGAYNVDNSAFCKNCGKSFTAARSYTDPSNLPYVMDNRFALFQGWRHSASNRRTIVQSPFLIMLILGIAVFLLAAAVDQLALGLFFLTFIIILGFIWWVLSMVTRPPH